MESFSEEFVEKFECKKGDVFRCQSCAVQKEYAGSGIGTDIVVNAVFFAKLKGYRYLFT